jgi:hypothetical protein
MDGDDEMATGMIFFLFPREREITGSDTFVFEKSG